MPILHRRKLFWQPKSCHDPAAGGAATTTLDSGNTGAGGTLSGGDLTLTYSSAAASSRSLTSHSSGKYYFEVTFGASMNAGFSEVGICNASQSMSSGQLGGSSNSGGCGFGDTGFYVGGSVKTFLTASPAAGSILGVAIDVDTQLIWITVNGVTWSSGGIGNPVTETGGGDISGVTGPYFAAVHVESNSNSVITVNFGGSAYAYTPPTGYANW
jgi:hypothetical protein